MTELGPIPKDWDVKRLGDCCSKVNNGFAYDVGVRGKYAITRIESISKGWINLDRVGWCKDCPGDAYLLVPGDVLYSHINSLPYIGNCAQFRGGAILYHGMNLLLLRPNNSVDADYFFKVMSSEPLRRVARAIAKVAINQASINTHDLKEVCLALPPLPEQRKIAAALSDVDEMIAALEKLIEKKRKIKTGAMQRLLTGKTRLPGFKGAWVEKRLGELGETYNGIGGKTKDDFGKGPARYITFLNVLTNPVLDETLFEPVNVLPADGQNRAKKGDLFFNTSSETPEEVGICSMLATDQAELYLNSFCFGFRLFDDNVSPLFLSYYFRSADGRLLMTTLAQGSTRYNLSKESFKEACIVIPPSLAEQKAIAKVLGDMDEEIAALEAELAKTSQLKQGMLQELLTGKVRLVK